MPWKPEVPGEIPTLGPIAIQWMRSYLATPDATEYLPFIPYVEQEDFILAWYALHPDGTRRFHRGVLGRPRGWGKSPLLAALACVEALAPVKFDGWDANGRPVGRPWATVRKPWVHLAAVSDDQTRNTWEPILDMLGPDAPVHDDYQIDVMETFIGLPRRGRIMAVTSAARTVKGARAHFAVLDQTEEWVPSNGGPKLARTMRTNAAKVGGTTLESPNAYTPGEDSVAEASANYWEDIKLGRARNEGLYYDHREAYADTDLDDYDSLIRGLRYSYGDSSGHPDGCVIHDEPCKPGHVDLDRLIATIWDTTQEEEDSRTDFLNQITQAADSWVNQVQVKNCISWHATPVPKDDVVLGFDGSRGRGKGKADATALIAVRVSDGLTWEEGVWEPGLKEKDWQPPYIEIDRKVDETMDRYRVVGFFADPSGWQEFISKWEAKYGKRLKVKATAKHPISVWPRGKTSQVVEAVEHARVAIATAECKLDPGSSRLMKHLLNARKRETPRGDLLYKSYPMSPDKIDAAYAFVMAWKARTDALSAGFGRTNRASSGRIVVSS